MQSPSTSPFVVFLGALCLRSHALFIKRCLYLCVIPVIDSLTRCYRAPTRPQSAADHICSNNARTLVCHTSSPLLAGDPFLYTISTEGSSDSCSTSSSSSEDLSLASLLVPPPENNFDLVMSPSSSALKHPQTADSRTPVYIDILPEHSQSRWVSPSSHASAPSSVPPTSPQAPSHSGSARRMRDIDPIVTFVSPTPINGKSSYIVLLDGAPIHSEDTKLVCVGPYVSSASAPSQPSSTGSMHGGPMLYNTALVPKYWDILSKAASKHLSVFPSAFKPYAKFFFCVAFCSYESTCTSCCVTPLVSYS